MAVQVSIASFSLTGLSDERKKSNKYSLKNLSNYSHKSLSIYALKAELQFKGSQALSPGTFSNGTEVNSMMQFDRGNTTYIFPYKFKIKIPKDKIRIPFR
jgi:hypothetical protein